MKKEMILEKYPVFVEEIAKDALPYEDVDGVIEYFKSKIEADSIATFIEVFNHYEHTKCLESGMINPEILDAKNIVFCFGEKLPDPRMLAVRPRSIGVAQMQNKFVVSFLEAPVPHVNDKMQEWVKELSQ